ncbi:MAG: 30S ribosomal protein S20 [Acidobacteria bacterium]|jgi:small subunit ribosomal protein S20|nr:30S ribosomal protein S20 [Acidobacteriota bacterium]
MPNHKSAEKRERQNKLRNAVNTSNRTRLRSQIRSLRSVIAAGNAQEAQTVLSQTVSIIDKAVQKGVLHRNTAARHKARLTVRVNAIAAK